MKANINMTSFTQSIVQVRKGTTALRWIRCNTFINSNDVGILFLNQVNSSTAGGFTSAYANTHVPY
jgi:hypothetical protein